MGSKSYLEKEADGGRKPSL